MPGSTVVLTRRCLAPTLQWENAHLSQKIVPIDQQRRRRAARLNLGELFNLLLRKVFVGMMFGSGLRGLPTSTGSSRVM